MLKLRGCLRGLGIALLMAVVATPAWAQSRLDQSLPVYRPVENLEGSVRLAGSTALGIQAEVWGDTFSLYYPNVTLEIDAKGSDTAIAALIKDEADVGMMSRELRENEVGAIKKFMGNDPIQLTPR